MKKVRVEKEVSMLMEVRKPHPKQSTQLSDYLFSAFNKDELYPFIVGYLNDKINAIPEKEFNLFLGNVKIFDKVLNKQNEVVYIVSANEGNNNIYHKVFQEETEATQTIADLQAKYETEGKQSYTIVVSVSGLVRGKRETIKLETITRTEAEGIRRTTNYNRHNLA